MKTVLTRSEIRLGSYTALLLTLMAYIIVSSVAQDHGTDWPWLTKVLLPLILFTTLGSAVESRRQLVVLIGAFLLFTAIDVAEMSSTHAGLQAASHAGHVVFLLFVIVVILRHVFRDREVTPDMVIGSVCAFLLLALAFNELYALVEVLHPGSFTGLTDVQKDGGYFSLVTLTTLGYGDVVPVKAVARSLAAIEAVVGQFYIAVIVARLVAQRMAHGSARRARDETA